MTARNGSHAIRTVPKNLHTNKHPSKADNYRSNTVYHKQRRPNATKRLRMTDRRWLLICVICGVKSAPLRQAQNDNHRLVSFVIVMVSWSNHAGKEWKTFISQKN